MPMKGRALLRVSSLSALAAAMLSGVSLFLSHCTASGLLPPALAYALLVLP